MSAALSCGRENGKDGVFGILKSPKKKLLLENNVEMRVEALDQEDVSSPEREAGSKQWQFKESC